MNIHYSTEMTSEISSKLLILQVRKLRPQRRKGTYPELWLASGRTKVNSVRSQISSNVGRDLKRSSGGLCPQTSKIVGATFYR